jgi:hypothetical protein
MIERSTYIWNYRGGDAKAQQIKDTGATMAWIKSGGDQGVVWIPGVSRPTWALPQWDDAYLQPLTSRGIACYPWFYNWPGAQDKAAVIRALEHRWSDVLALNPETEWRVASPHSPYNTLAEGNRYARAWVDDLMEQLLARFGKLPRIGFSGVPSWRDFPYEGFGQACDFGHVQHYWPAELLGGEDQVEAHYRRAPGCPCIPILTACREYDDAGVLRLAASALMHPIQGFSAWEAGNAAYQADAMRQAYALLPADDTQTSVTVQSPMIRAIKALLAA